MTNETEMREALEKKVRGAIYNTWHNKGIANVDGVARIAVGAIWADFEARSRLGKGEVWTHWQDGSESIAIGVAGKYPVAWVNNDHYLAASLICEAHNATPSAKPVEVGEAYHKGTKLFKKVHGSNEELLAQKQRYEEAV